MTEGWQYPVVEPMLTDALLEDWVRRERENGRKAKAFETPFRFSDAGACSRVLAFEAMGCEPTEPMDPAGVWVTGLGTMIHELLQEAISRRYPDARFEVKANLEGVTSGHCDAVIDLDDSHRVLFELKTTGGYAFDKAVGLQRKAYKIGTPEGPRRSAILQAGLNALAHEATTVIIGYIAMEAVSVGLAEKAGLRYVDRVLAEWHLPQDVWRPLAEAELARQEAVLSSLRRGALPRAEAPDDDGSTVVLDPAAQRPNWRCQYCRFRSLCLDYGVGERALDGEILETGAA